MTSAPSPVLVLVVVSCVLVALVGLLLFVGGMRVRRRGKTPHCRRCDYALTGLNDPAQCPECGAALTEPGAVALGEAYRRRELVWVGAAVLLVGAAPLSLVLAGAAGRYDWYRWRPTAWVLNDLERANSVRAATELARRYADGSMSAAHRDRFVGLALAEQARPTRGGPLPTTLVDFLADAESNGDLSAEQRRRFYEQMVILKLVAGPSTWPWPGSPGAVFTLNETCRSPVDWSVGITFKGVELQKVGEAAPSVRIGGGDGSRAPDTVMSGLGASGSMSMTLLTRDHGKHTVTAGLHVGVYKGPPANTPPVHEWDVTLTEEIDLPRRPWSD